MTPVPSAKLTVRLRERWFRYGRFPLRNNGAGTLIGGAAGGRGRLNESAVRTPRNILGAIGGAVVGGIAGNAAQEGLSSQSGYEYVIQLDNGSMVTVSQGNDVLLNPGQKCMVLYGKRARVVPYYGN